ncbi:MAG: hypothetical protein AAGB07_02695 [Pseudomonadota bacterium]
MQHVYRRVFGLELAGLPVLPTLLGSFLLMSTMFMWYGGLFKDTFYFGMGITEEEVTADALRWWYPIGLILSMSQGIGLAIVLKWRNWPPMLQTIQTALMTSVFFAALTFGYRLVILPDHNHNLFFVNASGIVTAFTICAIAICVLRPRKLEYDAGCAQRLLRSQN